MKAFLICLSCWLLLVFQGQVLADSPRESPAPILGSEDLSWVGEQESFRIGVRSDQVPLVFDIGNGKLAGTYIDYLELLSEKLGHPLEPVVVSKGQSMGPVQGAPATDTRLTTRMPGTLAPDGKRYTSPLMSLTYGLFVRAGDTAIRSLADLEKGRIAVVEGDPNQYSMLDSVDSFTPVPVSSLGEAVSRVLAGKADALVGPVPVVSDYLQSAMIDGIGLSVLLDQKSVDVVFQVDDGNRDLFRVLDRSVAAISDKEHRLIRQSWLEVDLETLEQNGAELSGSDVDWLKRHPDLTVGYRSDWPPFEFSQDGSATGLVPDLVARLEKQLSVSFQQENLENRVSAEQALASAEVDILPGLSRTPRTAESFLFTRAYVTVPIALAIRDDGRFIGDLRELRDEHVGVVNRHAAHDYLLINHPDLDLYPVSTVEAGLLALSNGDLDVMVTHIPAVSYTVARLGLSNLRITSITPYQYDLRLAVRKDRPELHRILSKALSSLEPAETETIYNRWIHLDIEQETDYTVVRRVVLIAIVVVLIFLYWNRKLSREVDERIRSENALRWSEEELRAAKLEAERLAHEAETASLTKSEFLANMSHEIRTPMNAVIGYSDLLSNSVTDPQHRNYLDAIRAGSRSLLMLINDILDLSRIEAGKMRLDYSPVSVRRLLDDVRHIFDLRAREQGITLEVSVESDMPVAMMLDETRFRQVLFNLVGNAIKFTHEGGVTVRASVQPGKVDSGESQDDARIDVEQQTYRLKVKVEDSGIGIPAHQLARIFEAFEQQEGQNTRRYGGTGLGLAISRKLARMMGGELEVSSSPGEGSAFTLTLPEVQATGDQAEDESATQESERLLAQTLSIQERGWLREKLTADFGDQWHEVRESGDPEEMAKFARQVLDWGHTYRSRSVTHYGEKLLADVEAFNLDAVNSALEAFPKLLGRQD